MAVRQARASSCTPRTVSSFSTSSACAHCPPRPHASMASVYDTTLGATACTSISSSRASAVHQSPSRAHALSAALYVMTPIASPAARIRCSTAVPASTELRWTTVV